MRRLLLILLLTLAGSASARLTIEITGGMEGALPIAIAPFGWQGAGPPPEDIAAIVSADLHRSGRFAPLPLDQLVEQPHEGREVDFAKWRPLEVGNLVVGRVALQDRRYLVEFQLFDIFRGTQLAGYSIRTDAKGLRRLAHQISDIVYEKLTGQRGAFDTHIAYVTSTVEADGVRRYRLAVADADGFDEQIILTSTQPLMSPAWSPDGKRLAYVSFESGRSAIYLQEVTTGQRQRLTDYPGINSAPAWSPDGRQLAMTLSKDGNPEIYILDLASKALQRVTHSYAIDTEPAWSPEGNALVFTSDRGGRPQIYQVTRGAGGRWETPRRITFEGDYNARPVYSPDGRLVATINGDRGRFRVGVFDLQSGALRVLTDTRLDESPSFAPNGSMLIYATEAGNRGVLEVSSVAGGAHQRLGLQQGDVREPSWSPFMTR